MKTRAQLLNEIEDAERSGDKGRIASLFGELDALPPAEASITGSSGPMGGLKDIYESAKSTLKVLPENTLESAKERMISLGLGTKQLATKKSDADEYDKIQKKVDEQSRITEKVEEKPGGILGGALVDTALAGLVPWSAPAALARHAARIPQVARWASAARGPVTVAPRVTSPVPGLTEMSERALANTLARGEQAAQAAARGPKFGTRALQAGVGGSAASAFEPVASDESQLMKMLLMGGGAAGGEGLASIVKRAITPTRTSSASRNASSRYRLDADVPVSAGQQTGSPLLRGIDMGLKSHPVTAGMTVADSPAQKAAVTRAGARSAGPHALPEGKLTPEAVEPFRTSIDARYDALRSAPGAPYDPELLATRQEASDLAERYARQSGQRPAGGLVDAQLNLAQEGLPHTVPGTPAVTRPGLVLDARGNPNQIEVAPATPDVDVPADTLTGQDFLDQRRALTSTARTADVAGDIETARTARTLLQGTDEFAARNNNLGSDVDIPHLGRQYAALEDMTNSLDEEKYLNMPKLAQRQRQQLGPTRYAAGEGGDLANLARAGETVLAPQGRNSGTAFNTLMAQMLQNPLGRGAVTTAGLVTLPLAHVLTNTKVGRRYLTNSLLNEGAGRSIREGTRPFSALYGAAHARAKEDKVPDWIKDLVKDEED